jgi:hypothetical protein
VLPLRFVVQRRSTLKQQVSTLLCTLVEGIDGGFELLRVDTALACQLTQGPGFEQVAAAYMGRCRKRKGFRPAQPIAALGAVIADQPGHRGFLRT